MSNILIKHQRTAAFTSCNGVDICQIELVDTKYSVKAKKNDKLKFQRKGAEKDVGFDVDIDPPFNNGSNFPNQGSANLNIDIPDDQAPDDYKYTISYPYDVDCTVAPLDPIIIIEPSFLMRVFRYVVTAVIAFIVGVSFTKYFY